VRYLRLLGIFWAASAAARMEYRAAFVVAIFASVIETAGKLFGVYLFYSSGVELGGWPWPEALLVLGFAQLVDAFFLLFFVPNLRRISEMVQDGTLDFVLLKPVDSQFWTSAQKLDPVGLPYLLLGVAVLGYAGWASGLSAGGWAWIAFAGIGAVFLVYALAFLLATTSIWFVKIFNVVYFLSSMIWSAQYPVQAYARPFRLFLTFVMPVYFMTTAPAELALGVGGGVPWAMFLVGLGLFGFSRAFWRFALRFYTSASS